MDLLYNISFVKKINKSKFIMRLMSNFSTMMASHKEKVPGYHRHSWFNKKAITNIVSLKNIGEKYLVTYRSDKKSSLYTVK